MGDMYDATIELQFGNDDELETLHVQFFNTNAIGKYVVKATFKYKGGTPEYNWTLYKEIWLNNVRASLPIRPDNVEQSEFVIGSLTIACIITFAGYALHELKDYKSYRESIILLSQDLSRAGAYLVKLVKGQGGEGPPPPIAPSAATGSRAGAPK